MGDGERSRRINTQIQMNIATACLSARYGEIARKASREAVQKPAAPRKGSPASRPKATGHQTPKLPPRTPSPRAHRQGSISSFSPSRTASPSIHHPSPSIRNTHGIRHSIDAAPSPTVHLPSMHTSPAPAPVASFDYLSKAGDVSPLVKSLSQHLGQMESHISDSLNRNKVRQNSVHRSVTAVPPPSVAAKELHHTQSMTPGATSMRHVSPPRRQGAVRRDTTPPQTATQKLMVLQAELGRVRQGIGATRDPVSGDWEWNTTSPAAMMADFVCDAQREMWNTQLWSMKEMVEVGRRSANVFKAEALIRDLTITSTHASEMAELVEKNRHLMEIVHSMEECACACYTMEHSNIETTRLVLRENGTHESDVGHGTYTFRRNQGSPHVYLTLTWDDDCDNISLVSTDHCKSWRSVDGADTVRLYVELEPPSWLRNEALSCELNAANHHSKVMRENEKQLREEVTRLRELLANKALVDEDTDGIKRVKEERRILHAHGQLVEDEATGRVRFTDGEEQSHTLLRESEEAERVQIEADLKACELAQKEMKQKAEEERREKEIKNNEAIKAAEAMRLAEEQRFAEEVRRAEQQREQEDSEDKERKIFDMLRATEEEELRKAEELKRKTEQELEEEKKLLEAERELLRPQADFTLDPSLDHSHLDPNIFGDDADFEPDPAP